MPLQSLSLNNFTVNPFSLLDKRWMLLTAGDFSKGAYNTMVIGWGSLGTMWKVPFVQVVVRPTRYTFEFMEEYPTFSVCAFPETCRKALGILGTKSGRDGDKIAEAGLNPVACQHVAAPAFAEADLVLECKKIYWQDLDPAHFLETDINNNYPKKDYHRIYFGEVLAIRGTEKYKA